MKGERLRKRRRIELLGGPLDGKSTIEQPEGVPTNLVLRHLPDGLGPKPGEEVHYSMCLYVPLGNKGVYEFAEEIGKTITAEAYMEHQGLLASFDMLRHLADDPRLLSGAEAARCNDTTLDIAEAEQLRAHAIEGFRTESKVRDELRDKSDDMIWAYIRIRLRSDLEWVDMGSIEHSLKMTKNAAEVFGVVNPFLGIQGFKLEGAD